MHLRPLMLSVLLLACPLLAQDYPLETCIVKGTRLGNNPVIIQHSGIEVRLCCNNCVKRFRADPDRYLAALREAMGPPAYPCDFCVVSGDLLGDIPPATRCPRAADCSCD